MQYLHQNGEEYKTATYQHQSVLLNPMLVVRGHKGRVFQSFYQHEIDNGCYGNTAKQTNGVFQFLGIIKGKEKAWEVLYQCTEEEGYGYREENTQNDGQGFFCIQQVGKAQHAGFVSCYLDEG